MPPRKQKAKPNGFMLFTSEWKQRNAPVNWTFQKCITEAGKVWDRMKNADRQPYHERAKQNNQTTAPTGPKTKKRKEQTNRNCVGDLVADVERRCKEAEKQLIAMNRTIDNTIRSAVHEYNLESTRFYFIMVNYFTKSLDGVVYIPAELALAEFSLEAGVTRVYHTHINPGVTAFGQLYQTQQHAESTHKLPLPPNALGEMDMQKINLDIINFLGFHDDKKFAELPPLYTTKENLPVVKSVLSLLKKFDDPEIRLFSIEYLFYALKDQTCKICGIESPKSQIITNGYFERDSFEYVAGFSCKYHEEIDCTKYCAQSYVTRWGYTFAEYMCPDLAIALEPGRHKPEESAPNFLVIDHDNKEPAVNLIENINSPLENYKRPAADFCNTEASDIFATGYVDEDRRSERNYQYPYESRDSSTSPTSLRAPSPPPPPQNLDFGYCNTSEQRLSPLFNQLLSANTDPSSSPSERLRDSPSLIIMHSESRQDYSPPQNMRFNSPNRLGYRSPTQSHFDPANSSPSRQRRSNSREIRSSSRQNRSLSRDIRSPSRQRRRLSNERRFRRATDRSRSPIYRSLDRRTQSPLSRDQRRSPVYRNRSPPRRAQNERRRSPQHSRRPQRNQSPHRRLSRCSPDNESYHFCNSSPTRRPDNRNEYSTERNIHWPNEEPHIGETRTAPVDKRRVYRRSLSTEENQYRPQSPHLTPLEYPRRHQQAPFERECGQQPTFNFGPNMNVPTQGPPYFLEQTNWQTANMPQMQHNNNNHPNGMMQHPNQFQAQNVHVQQFPPSQDLREFLQNRNPTIFSTNDCPSISAQSSRPTNLPIQQIPESDLRHRLQVRDISYRASEQMLGSDKGNMMNPHAQRHGIGDPDDLLGEVRRGFGPGISNDYNRNGFNY